MEDKLVEKEIIDKEIQDLYYKWRIADLISASFSNLGIITSTIDYEIGFAAFRNHFNCRENSNQIFRWITLGVTLFAIGFLIKRHWIKLKWYKKIPKRSKYEQKINIWKVKNSKSQKSLLSKQLFLELFLLSIFPYPYLSSTFTIFQAANINFNPGIEDNIEICYTTSELFYAFTFARLFFLIRALFNFAPYQDEKARKYCTRYDTKANVRFSLRCMLRLYPLLMITLFLFPSFFILGALLRIFERPFVDISCQNFDSYLNSVWCVALTMLTIGFGDFMPSTIFGRIVAVACSLWAAFSISMVISSIDSILELSHHQVKAFKSIIKSKAAAKIISSCLYYNLLKKKYGYKNTKAQIQWNFINESLLKYLNTMKLLNKINYKDKDKTRFEKFNKYMTKIEEKADRVLKNQALI